MAPGRFEAMLKAIIGYEMRVDTLRGTRKLGQHKGAEEMAGAIAGLEGAGHVGIAELMRSCSSARLRGEER
jgi:transcriptional regulator